MSPKNLFKSRENWYFIFNFILSTQTVLNGFGAESKVSTPTVFFPVRSSGFGSGTEPVATLPSTFPWHSKYILTTFDAFSQLSPSITTTPKRLFHRFNKIYWSVNWQADDNVMTLMLRCCKIHCISVVLVPPQQNHNISTAFKTFNMQSHHNSFLLSMT